MAVFADVSRAMVGFFAGGGCNSKVSCQRHPGTACSISDPADVTTLTMIWWEGGIFVGRGCLRGEIFLRGRIFVRRRRVKEGKGEKEGCLGRSVGKHAVASLPTLEPVVCQAPR